jgi:hypothetical protein
MLGLTGFIKKKLEDMGELPSKWQDKTPSYYCFMIVEDETPYLCWIQASDVVDGKAQTRAVYYVNSTDPNDFEEYASLDLFRITLIWNVDSNTVSMTSYKSTSIPLSGSISRYPAGDIY